MTLPAPAVDLAIVGGGFAGLTAANRAAQLGLTALVLERGGEELYACNSRYAGGVLHVSYQDVNAPVAQLRQAIIDSGEGWTRPELAAALAGSAGRALQWLLDEGAQLGPPDPAAWRRYTLAPVRPAVPEMTWRGHGADTTLRRLEANLLRRGGELRRGTRATALIMEEGRCVGVECTQNGEARACRARAVILADGGFQADPELLRAHITPAPERVKQRCAPTETGDGLRMALAAGAAAIGLEAFYGHLLAREAMHDDRIWPYPQIDDVAVAGIVVDERGKRIADEGRGGVYLSNAVARRADPLAMAAVFDEAIWSGPGRAATVPVNPTVLTAGGTVHSAATLGGLAAQMGVPADALEHTVAEYNAAVAARSTERLDPPRTGGKRKPVPIAEPPFHAIPICAGITFTMGGLAIDEHGRVLHPDRSPIPGLYAAGAITGGLCGGPICGYTGGIMKALVFGLLTAEHAAGKS